MQPNKLKNMAIIFGWLLASSSRLRGELAEGEDYPVAPESQAYDEKPKEASIECQELYDSSVPR